MGLNETLDRLKAEWEAREARMLVGTASIEDVNEECADLNEGFKDAKVADLAERIFFARMLKDINNGMGGDKIDILIERSVMIAEKLYNRLYK